MSSSADQLPEQLARHKTDAMRKASGWAVSANVQFATRLRQSILKNASTGEPK